MVFVKELVPAVSKQGCCLVCGAELDVDDTETDLWGRPEADHCQECGVSVHYEVMLLVTSITKDGKEYKTYVKKNGEERKYRLFPLKPETKPAPFN